jgi:hypothetical protein
MQRLEQACQMAAFTARKQPLHDMADTPVIRLR